MSLCVFCFGNTKQPPSAVISVSAVNQIKCGMCIEMNTDYVRVGLLKCTSYMGRRDHNESDVR